MAEEEKNIDIAKLAFGTLNDVSQAIGGLRERMDAGTDFMDAVVNVAKRQFIPDALANTGPYKAVVLRVEKQEQISEAGDWLSNTLGSFFGDTGQFVRIKARIPEIHASLPVPQKFGSADGPDQQIIDLYPTFVAQDTQIESPSPGDIVNVDFGNKNTYSDPIYLGPLVKTNLQAGAQGLAGSNAFANCTGNNNIGTTAPAGDSLPGQNETKEPLSLIPLAPRTGKDLQSPNEFIIGENGGLINVKNDWEKALKQQNIDPETGSPVIGVDKDENLVRGRTWIGNIPANGLNDENKLLGKDRDTIIFAPYSTNLDIGGSNRVEIIVLLHDFGGFSYDMFQAIAQSLVELQQRNYVLVIPEMPWSAYTDYASVQDNRIDVQIDYEQFITQTVETMDSAFGTSFSGQTNAQYLYNTVVGVGAGATTIVESKKANVYRFFGLEPNKSVLGISPNSTDQATDDLIKGMGTLFPHSDAEEKKLVTDILKAIESDEFYDVALLNTYTFIGYEGVYSTNLDKIVTSVANNFVGPDRQTDLVYYQGVKNNIDSSAFTARALVSDREIGSPVLASNIPAPENGSATSPDSISKEDSAGSFAPQSNNTPGANNFNNASGQACILPAGSAVSGLGGKAGKKYPVPDVPFNGGKSDVVVLNGVEYPFPGIVGGQQYQSRERKQLPSQLVIHNSVTSTYESCVRVLLNNGLGTHFTVDFYGNIYQHNDPITRIVYHGKPINNDSIGIEAITPFYGKNLKDFHLEAGFTVVEPYWWQSGDTTKKSGWAKPPEAQVKAMNRLLAFLTAKIPSLPASFPSKDFQPSPSSAKRFQGAVPPGIVSHRDYVAKADGRYYLLRYLESITGEDYLGD
jgi:hypothetical protein